MTARDKALLGLLLTANRALGAVQEAIGAAVAVLRSDDEEQAAEEAKRGKIPPMFGETQPGGK